MKNISKLFFWGRKKTHKKGLNKRAFSPLSWKIQNELASAFPERARYYILYGDKTWLICTNLKHKYKMFILCLVHYMLRFKTCVSVPWSRWNSKKKIINKHWEHILFDEIVCFWQWFRYYQVENFNQTQWIFISLADRVVIAWQAFGWEKDHRGSEQGEGIFFGLRRCWTKFILLLEL